MPIERQTAYKVWIRQITESTYIKQEGWKPSYIEVKGKQISRVNLLATVVSKYVSEDGNYGALTVDDGTDTIRAKAFGPDVKHIKRAAYGDIVRAVGKIKEYNEEKYLVPEAIRVVRDSNWLIVQRQELGYIEPVRREHEAEPAKEQETLAASIRESAPEEAPAPILEIIRELDEDGGAEIDKVIKKSGLEEDLAKKRIVDLLADGEIFEPRKGRLKVLD